MEPILERIGRVAGFLMAVIAAVLFSMSATSIWQHDVNRGWVQMGNIEPDQFLFALAWASWLLVIFALAGLQNAIRRLVRGDEQW